LICLTSHYFRSEMERILAGHLHFFLMPALAGDFILKEGKSR